MKRCYTWLLCLTISHGSLVRTEPGCMDNSYHLDKSYDHKTYEYVACTCPCKQYKQYFYNGYRCTKCNHAHDPKLAAAVRATYSAAASLHYYPLNPKLLQTSESASSRSSCTKTRCARPCTR